MHEAWCEEDQGHRADGICLGLDVEHMQEWQVQCRAL
jgi:hypothetical protein